MVGRTTVLALDGYEQVVGVAGLQIERPGLATLEDVVSDPRKRGLGIGRKVVEAAEDLGCRKGVRELTVASTPMGIPFYIHLKYERLGERIFRKFL